MAETDSASFSYIYTLKDESQSEMKRICLIQHILNDVFCQRILNDVF